MKKRVGIIGLTAILGFFGMSVMASEQDTAGITEASYREVLEQVTSRIRWVGTEGEQQAAEEIAQQMEGYGYEVTRQSFPFTEEARGKQNSAYATNVIAVKKADTEPNGDILIVSAHHDTKQSTTGAIDNASGTAMVLELARVMKDVDSDTEIRFVSFSAEEEGMKGSAYYVASLTEEEKERIVGDIQIDMIGHYLVDSVGIKTAMGQEELLAQLLEEASLEVTGSAWERMKSSASDHASFTYGGLPAVLVEQNGDGAENHRYSDRAGIVDAKKAVEAGAVVEKVIRRIASKETPSLSSEAHAMSAGDAYVTVTDRVPILFGASKEDVELKFGATGVLEREEPLEGTDLTTEYYAVQAKWFDWERPLLTEFVYMRTAKIYTTLMEVYIHTEPLGLSDEELAASLTASLGEPDVEDYGTIWGGEEMKDNLALRMYEISAKDEEQVIHVYGALHSTMGNDLKAFDFAKDTQEYADQCSAMELAMLETIHKVIPQEDPYVKQIISWTDGYSYILGTCTADDPTVSDSFSVRIDGYDFFDDEGNILDTGRMLATMVHEYGHALTLNAGQLNADMLSRSMNYNDISLYREDSYMKAFYDLFYSGDKQRSYADYPEDYVDQYAGESGMFEDIAESFMVFVTSSRPEDDSAAGAKVSFFYEYPELLEIRNYIRGNFGYPQDQA